MISNFKEFRRDGKIIHEGYDFDQIRALGRPSRVVRVEWENDGRLVEISNPYGLFVDVLPQRDALLCTELHDEEGASNSLRILNADGSTRAQVPSVVEIEGQPRRVVFMTTYPDAGNNTGEFAVVVEAPSLNANYKLFVDSYTGEVLRTMWIKY